MESMQPIAVVTVLAVFQAFAFAFLVGKQRVKHEVKAPAISGEAEFERAFRIHQNTGRAISYIPRRALWLVRILRACPYRCRSGFVLCDLALHLSQGLSGRSDFKSNRIRLGRIDHDGSSSGWTDRGSAVLALENTRLAILIDSAFY